MAHRNLCEFDVILYGLNLFSRRLAQAIPGK